MTTGTYVNRGRCWASDKANLCVTRAPSVCSPFWQSLRVGFRVFLRVREVKP